MPHTVGSLRIGHVFEFDDSGYLQFCIVYLGRFDHSESSRHKIIKFIHNDDWWVTYENDNGIKRYISTASDQFHAPLSFMMHVFSTMAKR